jgi:hypothetical protein
MSIWVTVTEATEIIAGYPVTEPENYEQYLNLAFLYLSNDFRYSFPSSPTDKMKTALSLYAVNLGNSDGSESPLQRGVSSFTIGDFSENYSNQAIQSRDEYPRDIALLLNEYRTGGRETSIHLTRTYPSP